MKLVELAAQRQYKGQWGRLQSEHGEWIDVIIGPFDTYEEATKDKTHGFGGAVVKFNEFKTYENKFGQTDPNGKWAFSYSHKDSGHSLGIIGPFTTQQAAQDAAERYEDDNGNRYSDGNRHETNVYPLTAPRDE